MNHRTTSPPISRPSTTYEVRVASHLDDHWATWLNDLTPVRHKDGTTVLTGPLADQSQLHGLLARIRDLGIPLLALSTSDSPAPEAGSLTQPTRLLRHRVCTERLTLRPAIDGDADATWAYRRLPSVGQWLTELATDVTAYRSAFTDPQRLAATVMVEREGHVVGDLMLRVEDAWAQAEVAADAKGAQVELGWVLDPSCTGHGYATEAVRALLRYCFTDLGTHRVVATCFLANDTSWRLMERIGMRREGHAVSESRHRSGRWLDTVTYAVLAAEWPQDSRPEGPDNAVQGS
jgi:RimJ/RimL family protein N-acetyltransferase